MKKIILVTSLFCLVAVVACKKKTVYDCAGVTSTYTANVKTIIDTKCATSGCHSAAYAASGIDLSTYALVKSHTPHNSFLGSIEHAKGYEAMPKNGGKLSDAEIKLIACWINNNTPE